MPHAILVRKNSGPGSCEPEILASDIASQVAARQIAWRIALSYPHHGIDPIAGVYWFQDMSGVNEIWAQFYGAG